MSRRRWWTAFRIGLIALNAVGCYDDIYKREWLLLAWNGFAILVIGGIQYVEFRKKKGGAFGIYRSHPAVATYSVRREAAKALRIRRRELNRSIHSYLTIQSAGMALTAQKLFAESRSTPEETSCDGYVIGWRLWRVDSTSGILLPKFKTIAWNDTGWTHAQCTSGRHPAPLWTCECGLYVRTDWESLYAQAMVFVHDTSDVTVVFGAVLAYGEIVFHEPLGFRAEYARPIAMAAEINPAFARVAAEAHEIPLVPIASLRGTATRILTLDRYTNAQAP